MTDEFTAIALHLPSRRENIGGVFRAADVYGVKLVALGGGELPPEPLGHPTDTTEAWRRIPTVFADDDRGGGGQGRDEKAEEERGHEDGGQEQHLCFGALARIKPAGEPENHHEAEARENSAERSAGHPEATELGAEDPCELGGRHSDGRECAGGPAECGEQTPAHLRGLDLPVLTTPTRVRGAAPRGDGDGERTAQAQRRFECARNARDE